MLVRRTQNEIGDEKKETKRNSFRFSNVNILVRY